MPELCNHTPYPNFRYFAPSSDGVTHGVLIVKATYQINDEGRLHPAEEQAPLMFTDACFGAVNITSLWHPSDLVPHKPGADIIVHATAYPPDGHPTPSWNCGVKVLRGSKALVEKRLSVTGPRAWVPRWKRPLPVGADWRRHEASFEGWHLEEPVAVEQVPLRYELAFGGEIEIGKDRFGTPIFETSHHNPLGRGMINRDETDRTTPIPAPQIEDPNAPIADPFARPAPQSLGPIPPAWLPRRPKAGTFDEDWQAKVWPAWPEDYTTAYHQSAHPDLILDDYLRGDEQIILNALAKDQTEISLTLPGETLHARMLVDEEEYEYLALSLDTLLIDATAESIFDWRVFLSWRGQFEDGRWNEARIFSRGLSRQQRAAIEELEEASV